MTENNNSNKKSVPWYIFVWAIAVLLTLYISNLTTTLTTKADVGLVKERQAEIRADLSWIKNTLTDIKAEVKK